jgi:hypothetical protein
VWYTAAAVQEKQAAELGLGDVVRLRKPHPCGSQDWQVVRVGADIGLRCQGCGRRVLLARSVLRSRLKVVVARQAAGPEGPGAAPPDV